MTSLSLLAGRTVHECCLPYDKHDSDKAVHNLQLTSARLKS